MIHLIILLIIVGALLYLLRTLPIDETVKTFIYVIVICAGAIWLLKHLSMFGLA